MEVPGLHTQSIEYEVSVICMLSKETGQVVLVCAQEPH